MRRIVPLLLSLLLVALLASTATSQILRLRTGKFLIGSVEEANEQGVRFKRLDTGGVLDLGWSDLNAGDAKVLRQRFHLLGDETQEDVLIEAMRLRYVRGAGLPQVYVGELISKGDGRFVLRKRGIRVEINVRDIRGQPEMVRVPILDVLTPDEVYQRRLAELEPGEDANKHALLGVYLVRVGDYKRAKQHFEKAKELGGGDQPREVAAQLVRIESLLAHKAEADLLKEINILRNRKRFTRALALCAEFETKYPNSQLKAEFQRGKLAVQKDRETWLIRQVTRTWYRLLRDETGRIARSVLDFEKARSMVEDELGQTIRTRAAKLLKIKPDELERLFKKRFERKVAKVQVATYSTGSWIIGEQKVIAGTAAEKLAKGGKKKKGGASQGDKLRRDLDKRLKAWLRKASSAAGQGKAQGTRLQTEDQWWKEVPSPTRQMWLLAYYAENTSDMRVLSAGVTVCSTCGGRGTIQSISPVGGQMQTTTCPLCHHVKFVRGIRFQ